jgi:hypothetical protein
MPFFRIVASPWPLLALILKTKAATRGAAAASFVGLPTILTTISTNSKRNSNVSYYNTRSTIININTRRRMQHDSSFQDELIGKQKQVSMNYDENQDDNLVDQQVSATSVVEKHLDQQQKVFDEMSQFFDSEEATPPEVEPVLDYLVKKALVQCIENKEQQDDNDDDEKEGEEQVMKRVKIMDVACGTGALFPSYIKAAEELGIVLDIRGIDLSPQMTKFAIQNGQRLVEKLNGRHSVECYDAGDFVQLVMGMNQCEESVIGFDYGCVKGKEDVREMFDVCVMNACFGNFLDLGTLCCRVYICFFGFRHCFLLMDVIQS